MTGDLEMLRGCYMGHLLLFENLLNAGYASENRQ